MTTLKIVYYFLSSLCCVIAVAFYTVLERKVLAYCAIRVGPNKVRLAGLIQPFADGVKIICKRLLIPIRGQSLLFFFAPLASMTFRLAIFSLFFNTINTRVPLSVLFFLAIIAISVFPPAVAGWSSGSIYGKLGGLRNLVQTVSFEITLFIILLFPLVLFNTFSFMRPQNTILFLSIVSISLFIIILAETNRAPFDLAEGERELVSGFNIEYGGGGFIIFFLAEYAQIISLCLVTSTLIIGEMHFIFFFFFFLFLFLFSRAAFPRLRYDYLIIVIWVGILPLFNSAILILIYL